MTNKEKFMEYAKRRLREKEYKKRSMQNDLNDLNIRAIEKASRKKVGQI